MIMSIFNPVKPKKYDFFNWTFEKNNLKNKCAYLFIYLIYQAFMAHIVRYRRKRRENTWILFRSTNICNLVQYKLFISIDHVDHLEALEICVSNDTVGLEYQANGINWTSFKCCLKAGTHQANGRPSVSVCGASLFGVFPSSALVVLMPVVCTIQHVESASRTASENSD